jgi:large subunit ribosomal protein L14
MESVINIADNSGIKKVKMIKSVGQGKLWAGSSRMLVASVVATKPRRKIKKGDLVKVIVFRTKVDFRRLVGVNVKSGSNSGVLLKKADLVPYGNRVKTVGSINLRRFGFSRVLSLSKFVL